MNANKFIRRKGQSTTNTSAASTTVSTAKNNVDHGDNTGFPTPPPTPSGSSSNGNTSVARQMLDSTYPPSIQPDYGGKIFSHQYSRLRQLPVYDNDSNLVPTEDLWQYLRPGTLIMLNADLVCWVYEDDKRRKVLYHFEHFGSHCDL